MRLDDCETEEREVTREARAGGGGEEEEKEETREQEVDEDRDTHRKNTHVFCHVGFV